MIAKEQWSQRYGTEEGTQRTEKQHARKARPMLQFVVQLLLPYYISNPTFCTEKDI